MSFCNQRRSETHTRYRTSAEAVSAASGVASAAKVLGIGGTILAAAGFAVLVLSVFRRRLHRGWKTLESGYEVARNSLLTSSLLQVFIATVNKIMALDNLML